MDTLQLEDRFTSVASGTRISLVAELVTYSPGAHVCRTVVFKQFFHCDWYIKPTKGRFTVFDAILVKFQGKVWIQCDGKSKVVEHHQTGITTPIQAVEVCAGIGAMGMGLRSCGITTQCYVEYNPKFCKWLRDHGHESVIEGNISNTQVVIQVAEQAPGAQMLVGGVACQPFSRLGDRREQEDQRSESFPAFLRMMYLLQIPVGIMECTSEVLESSWAQGLLNAFADATGSCCAQKVLHLHRCWPAFRTRWWAVITKQGIPAMTVDDLPDISFTPGIVHLIPRMMPIPSDELSQMELDLYELRAFHSCKKGVQSCIVEKCRPMATATHSWGSQVVGCMCGCRKEGFSQARLDRQGLHGAVCVLPGYATINGEEVSYLRHLHPQEVALMCGLVPSWVTPSASTPLRLELAAVGQMASPLQSGWVVGQLLSHLKSCSCISGPVVEPPKQILWDLVQTLFQERDKLWRITTPTRYMDIFQTAIVQTLSGPDTQGDSEDFHHALLKSVKDAEQELGCQEALLSYTHSEGEHDEVPDADILDYFQNLHATDDPYQVGEAQQEIPHESPCKVEPFAYHGGIPGFRSNTHKRSHDNEDGTETIEPVSKRSNLEASSIQGLSPAKTLSTSAESDIDPDVLSGFLGAKASEPGSEGQVDLKSVQVIREGMAFPQVVRVPSTTKIQQLLDAEGQVCGDGDSIVARDCIGQVIPPDRVVQPFQRIHIENQDEFVRPGALSGLQSDTRYSILLKQGPWVANDEMEFYLHSLQDFHRVKCLPPLCDPIQDDPQVLEWMIQIVATDTPSTCVVSAICRDEHWFPIAAMHKLHHVQVFTNQAGYEWISDMYDDFEGIEIRVCDGASTFMDDCGFQTVGWLAHLLACSDISDSSLLSQSWSISSSQAEVLRSHFEHHLHVSGLAKQIAQPQGMHFGGVTNGQPEDQLRKMLEEHGVPKDKLQSRVGMVMEKLGRAGVIQSCRSPRPWQELKALANSQTPKIQLILPSELAEKIRERVELGDAFGDRKKKKHETKKEQPFPRLQPDDLSIPPAIFKQGRDEPVKQLGFSNIGVDASGVVLVTAEQAQPYLKLNKPLSKHGLALLVLDHDNGLCGGLGEVLRCPARFDHTNEPIIATARLIQLGQLEVSRHLPPTQIKVEEVQTCVIRALVFRDEVVDQEWKTFVQHPVKYILAHCQSLQPDDSESSILDVWDRQFVTGKFEKRKPIDAEIFIVTVRLNHGDIQVILAQSGNAGIYFEPRSRDGRKPDEEFRVTWLAKVDKANALSAVKASPEWAALVRSGARYGIRSTCGDAAAIHNRLKPNTPFLVGNEMLTFLVGPFPYGATRLSLQKVFQQWCWGARPLQPKGRAQDNAGILWEVQSTVKPEFEVYSMEHGDVVIIEAPKRHKGDTKNADVLASAKTIAVMRQVQTPSAIVEPSSSDPWVREDPWGSYVPPSKIAKSSVPPLQKPDNASLETIHAAVDRKVAAGLHALEEKLKPVEDALMSSVEDERVSILESRMSQLEVAISQQQQHQQVYEVSVAQQFAQVQTQIESQASGLQRHLDQRLQEQLGHIERLLHKKPREGGE